MRDPKLIEQTVAKALENDQVELVDLVIQNQGKKKLLQFFVDKIGGITLDDCGALTDKIDAVLEMENLIEGAYILEVSSPGIDRVLRKPRDLVREQGKAVDVTLYAPMDGKKNLTGVLTGFDGEKFTLDDELTIELNKAAQIRLHIDF